MAIVIHPSPVNPAQVKAVLLLTEDDPCTVRANDADGTCEVDAPGISEAALTAALAGIVYDASFPGV